MFFELPGIEKLLTIDQVKWSFLMPVTSSIVLSRCFSLITGVGCLADHKEMCQSLWLAPVILFAYNSLCSGRSLVKSSVLFPAALSGHCLFVLAYIFQQWPVAYIKGTNFVFPSLRSLSFCSLISVSAVAEGPASFHKSSVLVFTATVFLMALVERT